MKLKDLFEADEISSDEEKRIEVMDILPIINRVKNDVVRRLNDKNEKNDDAATRVAGTNARSVNKILDGSWASDKDKIAVVANFLVRNGLTIKIDSAPYWKKVKEKDTISTDTNDNITPSEIK